MGPAHFCLGVWELLENVLLNLSATDLARVMRVSCTWMQLIKQSARLRNNLVVVPLAKQISSTDIVYSRLDDIPKYTSDAELRVNPVLQAARHAGQQHFKSGESFERIDKPIIDFLISLPTCGDETLEKQKDEFAAFPPCQRMLVHKQSAWTVCTVFVKDGIRIKDLLAVAASLHATDKLVYGDFEGDEEAMALVMAEDE